VPGLLRDQREHRGADVTAGGTAAAAARAAEATGETGTHAGAEAGAEGRSAAAWTPAAAAGAGLVVVDRAVERRGRRRAVGAVHYVGSERRPVAVPAPLALTRTETRVVGVHDGVSFVMGASGLR
jgi:hypothetical protein